MQPKAGLSQPSQCLARTFISYEDRLNLLDGLKLLCLSFSKHCPDEHLKLFFPEIPLVFIEWIEQKQLRNIELIEIESEVSGWSVKTELLINCLEQGFEEVIWVDSDIILTGDIIQIVDQQKDESIILANCPGISDERRATIWKLKVCRSFDFLINTCFIRVTSYHKELLSAWRSLIYSPKFQSIQRTKFKNRPSYLFGDQDLLEGLLMSEDFCSIPVNFTRHGHEIIHASNIYSIRDRLKVVFNYLKTGKYPVMFHAHGIKPWMLIHRKSSSSNLSDVLVELSPFIKAATPYKDLLESDTTWIKPRTLLGKLCNLISFYNPHLRGIPILIFIRLRDRLSKAV